MLEASSVNYDVILDVLSAFAFCAVLIWLLRRIEKYVKPFLDTRRGGHLRYRGIQFRSRTEIAWAKWFEQRGIAYAYEPQPYFFTHPVTGRGMGYLPDFLLQGDRHSHLGLGPFVEIKGPPPTAFESWKCQQLANQTQEGVTLLAGWPGRHTTFRFQPRVANARQRRYSGVNGYHR